MPASLLAGAAAPRMAVRQTAAPRALLALAQARPARRSRAAPQRQPRGFWLATRDGAYGATAATNGSSDAEAAVDAPPTPTTAQQQPSAGEGGGGDGSDSDDSGINAAAAATDGAVRSHPLAMPEDPFAADELVAELSDTSSLGKRGEVYFAAQALVMLFVLFPPFKLAGLFDLMATLALTAGLVFCVYGLISIGRYISPLPTPRKNHKLVTDGLFAYVRHPMYGGLVLVALGLAAITRNEGRLALALVLWFVLERKVTFEEGCLAQRYGSEYKDYAAKTKKFIPFLY